MTRKIKTNVFSLTTMAVLVVFILAAVSAPLRVVNDFVPKAGDLAFVAHASNDGHTNDEVIVQLKPGKRARDVARRHNMEVRDDLDDDTYLFGDLGSRTVEQAVAELNTDPDVVSAEPNFLLQVPEVDQRAQVFVDQRAQVFVDGQSPADYFDQYAIALIRAVEAQAISTGIGVTVAVIDTGVDLDHPALSRRLDVRRKSDYVDNDDVPFEEGSGIAYGHGTMVAGIIALVAPAATIMPLRAFDSNGQGEASKVGKAIREAAKNGAQVINMSFGLATEAGPVRSAIQFASRRGVVLIASAGNNNTSFPPYPASDSRVLAVGATNQADVKADFSNYGSYIAVGAPGVSIYSAYPGGLWAWGDGTSFSAALVSGEAALVLSVRGGDAGQIIKNTTVPCCRGLLGRGRIDALAAVSR